MPKGIYDRKKGGRKVALTYKDNFWSKRRVEYNVTIDEIAELLHINQKTASAYFTGQCKPHDDQIKTLCEFFDVDIIEGTREFYKAYKSYDSSRKRELKLSAKTKKKIEEATKEEPAWNDEPTPVEKVAEEIAEAVAIKTDKVMEAVYKKLCYEDYKALMRFVVLNENADIEKWLYTKVDYDTFKEIEKILGE